MKKNHAVLLSDQNSHRIKARSREIIKNLKRWKKYVIKKNALKFDPEKSCVLITFQGLKLDFRRLPPPGPTSAPPQGHPSPLSKPDFWLFFLKLKFTNNILTILRIVAGITGTAFPGVLGAFGARRIFDFVISVVVLRTRDRRSMSGTYSCFS